MKTPRRRTNGQRTWLDEQGRPHRLGGPAIITDGGTRFWFVEGRLHRTDGPAVEYASGRTETWINGLPSNVLDRAVPTPWAWVTEIASGILQGVLFSWPW